MNNDCIPINQQHINTAYDKSNQNLCAVLVIWYVYKPIGLSLYCTVLKFSQESQHNTFYLGVLKLETLFDF